MTAATPDRTRPGMSVTRLCVIVAALAWLARTRVAVLPGWVVPLPALVLAALALGCAALVTITVLRLLTNRPRWQAVPATAWEVQR